MLKLLRQRNFGCVWIAGLISTIGDFVLFIALPFYIYDLTGSALLTGGMFVAQTLPSLLWSSLAGVFVDRWDRRRTMIVADLTRAAVLLLLLLVHSREWIGLVYVAAFLESSMSQFFNPAKSALVPELVDEQQLLAANSLTAISDALPQVLGLALGGVLFAALGFHSIIWVDTISYLLSATLLFMVAVAPHMTAEIHSSPVTAAALVAVWQDWRAGVRLVRADRLVTMLFVIFGIASLSQGLLNVLLVPFVKSVLHGGSVELGQIVTAQGVGGLIGSFLLGRLGKTIKPTVLMGVCGIISGLILLAIYHTATLGPLLNLPPVLLATGLIGIGGMPFIGLFITIQTMLQASVADQFRGRVFGTLGMAVSLMLLLGLGLGSVLGDRIGIVQTLNISAMLYCSIGLLPLLVHMQPAALPPPQPLELEEQL
ncbi:MAG: MFS transporter [Herpetosiphonaceae bacterium]|nr:MFS transporter [Herpetosiphonaceae bacterium]